MYVCVYVLFIYRRFDDDFLFRRPNFRVPELFLTNKKIIMQMKIHLK